MKHQFEPHKLKKKQIQAIHNHVIVSDMAFDERLSRGGIWLANDNGTGNGIRPRWGRVYTVGPEQKEIQAGQWVLVAHGRWTRGLEPCSVDHHAWLDVDAFCDRSCRCRCSVYVHAV